jgi:hypothetical protein
LREDVSHERRPLWCRHTENPFHSCSRTAKPFVESSKTVVEKGTLAITVDILRLWETTVDNLLVEGISAECQADITAK